MSPEGGGGAGGGRWQRALKNYTKARGPASIVIKQDKNLPWAPVITIGPPAPRTAGSFIAAYISITLGALGPRPACARVGRE